MSFLIILIVVVRTGFPTGINVIGMYVKEMSLDGTMTRDIFIPWSSVSYVCKGEGSFIKGEDTIDRVVMSENRAIVIDGVPDSEVA